MWGAGYAAPPSRPLRGEDLEICILIKGNQVIFLHRRMYVGPKMEEKQKV